VHRPVVGSELTFETRELRGKIVEHFADGCAAGLDNRLVVDMGTQDGGDADFDGHRNSPKVD
jgi:hypothetical protein